MSMLIIMILLIEVEGTKTPAGEARLTRPRKHEVERRLVGRPKVREVPGTEINIKD